MRWLSLLTLVVASNVQCSDLERFVRWFDEFMNGCATGPDMNWFETCSWVKCPCLQKALLAPVPNEEVQPCYEQGMGLMPPVITPVHQQFTLALMQTCQARTDELSAPCGVCDRYRDERVECREDNEMGDAETPIPTLPPQDSNAYMFGLVLPIAAYAICEGSA